MRFIQYLIIGENQVFGKLLTNQKIAHKIVKPYVYKALREGLKLMTTVKYKISEGSIPSLSEVRSITRASKDAIPMTQQEVRMIRKYLQR